MAHAQNHLDPASARRVEAAFQAAADQTAPTPESIASLIAQAHALAGVSRTATIGLLQELANDIRAGTPRPGSRVAHHANHLHAATRPDSLPVFIRARRSA